MVLIGSLRVFVEGSDIHLYLIIDILRVARYVGGAALRRALWVAAAFLLTAACEMAYMTARIAAACGKISRLVDLVLRRVCLWFSGVHVAESFG